MATTTEEQNVEQTEEVQEEKPEVTAETIREAIGMLPSPEAKRAAQAILESGLEDVLTPEEVLKNLAAADYNPTKCAQALAVVAMRLTPEGETAWWKIGQKVGVGTEGKNRSGGTTARSRYNAAIFGEEAGGKEGKDATRHSKELLKQIAPPEDAPRFVKKRGWYVPVDAEGNELEGEDVKSLREDDLPEDAVVLEATG